MRFSDRISAKGFGLSSSQWLSIYDHKMSDTTQRGASVRKRTEGWNMQPAGISWEEYVAVFSRLRERSGAEARSFTYT